MRSPFEYWPEMSMFRSAIVRTVSATTTPAGTRPALAATSTSLPYCAASPSAIWLRQQLPTQTNRTFFFFLSGVTIWTRIVRGREDPSSARDETWPPDGGLARPERDHPGKWPARGRRVRRGG